MLSHIFKSVLLLSCVGGGLSIILFALKPVTKRIFGSRWQYYIWLAVLIVMISPITISLPAEMAGDTQPAQITQGINAQTTPPTNNALNTVTQLYSPIQQTVSDALNNITISVYDLITYVWLSGALLFFASGLIKYWLFVGTIHKNSILVSCPEIDFAIKKMGLKSKFRVRSTNCINAPLMVGVFRPTLVLPDIDAAKGDLHYILLHELTHLKRRDLWYKWFAMFVNTVHWFNPFIYFVVRQINIECEISCDLTVTQNMTEQEKNGYMNTILILLSNNKSKEQVLTTAMASNKKQIKTRFMMIREKRKSSIPMSVISVITAVFVISITFFTSGVLASAVSESNGPITEINGGILTYYEAGHSLEENVRHIFGNPLSDANNELTTTIRQTTLYYIDSNGKKIANDYKGTVAYGVYLGWIENNEENSPSIYKTVLVEGRTVNVGFSDQSLPYKDDMVIDKMIETQIAFELGVGTTDDAYGYDHTAFIDELIRNGIYMIEQVIEPQDIKPDLRLSSDGTYVIGHKLLTAYDNRSKNSDIFSGKAEIPQNSDVTGGLQLGDAFTVQTGESLVIDILNTSRGLNKIHWAIVDAVTGETAMWMPNAPSGERWIFIPLDGIAGGNYKLMVSAEENGQCEFDVFTCFTYLEYLDLIEDK